MEPALIARARALLRDFHVSHAVTVDGADDHAIYVEIDGRRHIIAECFGRSDEAHTHPALAYATLFAASVDLLKALRDALDSLEYIERAHPGLTGCGVRQARIQAARAAIAAATTPTPG